MPDLIGLAVPTDPNSMYDAAAFVPDAIVINLGTNDFSATYGAPNPASFSGAYLTLLGNLRATYPNAKVFLAIGPMLSNGYPQNTTYLSDAARALESIRAAAQNPNIAIITLATLSDTERGCDSHPTAAAHARMASSLTAALKKALDW
jgi:lysophospholipase L1-like esterase